mmetsp:Transcript_19782/g.41021  ORF Transcript_19782/g.41021 Transcript_19782/m.41021 type:complete len:238 (+) Transcript_19782:490-1203(+)
MLIPRNPSPSTHRRHGRPVVALGLLQQHQILQIDALRPTVSVRIHAPIPRPEILPKHQGRGPIKDVGIDRLGGVFLSEEFEVGDPFVLLLEGLDDVGAAGARGGEGEVMVRGRAVVDGWYVVAWIGYVKVIVVVIVVAASFRFSSSHLSSSPPCPPQHRRQPPHRRHRRCDLSQTTTEPSPILLFRRIGFFLFLLLLFFFLLLLLQNFFFRNFFTLHDVIAISVVCRILSTRNNSFL